MPTVKELKRRLDKIEPERCMDVPIFVNEHQRDGETFEQCKARLRKENPDVHFEFLEYAIARFFEKYKDESDEAFWERVRKHQDENPDDAIHIRDASGKVHSLSEWREDMGIYVRLETISEAMTSSRTTNFSQNE